MSPIRSLLKPWRALRYSELCGWELREVSATPGRYLLWGRRMPGAPGSTPGRPGCKEGDAGLSSVLSRVLSSNCVHTAPFLATASHAPPCHAPEPFHALCPPGPLLHLPTHPTLLATGLIDSWDTKTWQAKRLSSGCLVMKPK